ncbi:MAG: OmpA family protein [Rhodospirillaceae bacterium]
MKIFGRLTVLAMAGALIAACSANDLDATKTMKLSGDKDKAMKALGGAKPAAKKAAKKAAKPQEFVIFFAHNKATLDDEAIGTAYNVMAASDAGRRVVLLTGHADTSGDKAYNRKLSEKRANAVAAALREIGIEPDKILTQFFGEDEPAVKTGDGKRNANNRRVHVLVK